MNLRSNGKKDVNDKIDYDEKDDSIKEEEDEEDEEEGENLRQKLVDAINKKKRYNYSLILKTIILFLTFLALLSCNIDSIKLWCWIFIIGLILFQPEIVNLLVIHL